MHRLNWSDLETVLAVATQGSAAGAARALGVNHATVIRRIKAFEARLPDPVFEHRRDGYRLTTAGTAFVEAAQSMEVIVRDLERKAMGGEQTLSGHVRITTTDSLFPVLADEVAGLRDTWPDITLDISMTNKRLDLFNRDADIALRPSDAPPPDLVGRRVGKLVFAAYATAGLADQQEMNSLPWLAPDQPLMSTATGQFLTNALSGRNVVARADSFVSLRQLAEASVGCAILPTYVGDPSPSLKRLHPGPDRHVMDLWLLSHPDIIRAQRVRVCMDFLYDALKRRFAEG